MTTYQALSTTNKLTKRKLEKHGTEGKKRLLYVSINSTSESGDWQQFAPSLTPKIIPFYEIMSDPYQKAMRNFLILNGHFWPCYGLMHPGQLRLLMQTNNNTVQWNAFISIFIHLKLKLVLNEVVDLSKKN